MGINASKPSDSSVPKLKSDYESAANSDPRSPTPEIIRTPLQGKSGPKHNITKNADLRKTFENSNGEEKLIHKNPILSAVIKNHLQLYDPRSPTQDFERTPVIILSKACDLSSEDPELQNENFGSPLLNKGNDESYDSGSEAQDSSELLKPKNLADGFYDLTLNETINVTNEPLGSSTASNEAIENNIPHLDLPKNLLETNFDYIETEAEKLEVSNETDNSTNEVKIQSCEDLKHIPQFIVLPDDPRSPSSGIERTPIVVSKSPEDNAQENVEEMSDDTLIKVLQSTNADLRQSLIKPKNDGLLIYEDDSSNLVDTPRKSKLGTNGDSRTPLSCMKNKGDVSHLRSKSANMCEEAKKTVPVKSRRASHIPRLKALSKQAKFNSGSTISLKSNSKIPVESGDCENTPPHSHRDKWDKDNSIVL